MTRLDRSFHALADPTRRAVLAQLTGGEASVSQLAEPFAVSLPTFLAHLRVLEEGGLIHTRKQGRVRLCRLATGGYAPLQEWLEAQRQLWEGRSDRLAEFVTREPES
ncbi:transcriptional regulator [Paracoccus suum]|uniref:Transcriptional regulator n=1 Tax=Paracoccus suum TaxID=2259340 RepID=A0A344PJU0_9RHOB|nr:metalloregulator ArsR/SmtB family transcription factor [Paracoccus suum]AXC49645.1 transcriptional regulator [Paracoccus suum]